MQFSFIKQSSEVWLYLIFGIVIIVFFIFDIGILNRKKHEIHFKEALYQTIFWIVVSLIFNFLVFRFVGKEEGYEFLAAYVTEKSLSVDNIFVFILVLNYFDIKKKYYHEILFYGVVGAIIFRAIFIFIGGALVSEFNWILYIFGGILIYTGVKLFFSKEETKFEPEKNFIYKFMKKNFRFSTDKESGKFIIKEHGKTYLTILFLVVVVIETTDIVFALDSIPAVFAISQDTFVIYTSNIFAVMGLRALFFLLRDIMDKFQYLQQGISIILFFIGAKMLAEIFHFEFSTAVSLFFILGVLTFSVILSLMVKKKDSII